LVCCSAFVLLGFGTFGAASIITNVVASCLQSDNAFILLRARATGITTHSTLTWCLVFVLLDFGAAPIATVVVAGWLRGGIAPTFLLNGAATITIGGFGGFDIHGGLFRSLLLDLRDFMTSARSTTSRHLAVGRQRATAESELLDNAAANAFTLSNKRLEPFECRGEMAVASTGAQNGVRLANKLATLVPAVASSLDSIMCADLATVGVFDLGLALGGILAAGAIFADDDVGPAAASILLCVAGAAFRRSRERFLTAVVVPNSLTGGLFLGIAAGGSSAMAQSLRITRNRATTEGRNVVDSTIRCWLSMAFEQTQTGGDAAQTLV
jgi:hypothetical protein